MIDEKRFFRLLHEKKLRDLVFKCFDKSDENLNFEYETKVFKISFYFYRDKIKFKIKGKFSEEIQEFQIKKKICFTII